MTKKKLQFEIKDIVNCLKRLLVVKKKSIFIGTVMAFDDENNFITSFMFDLWSCFGLVS